MRYVLDWNLLGAFAALQRYASVTQLSAFLKTEYKSCVTETGSVNCCYALRAAAEKFQKPDFVAVDVCVHVRATSFVYNMKVWQDINKKI